MHVRTNYNEIYRGSRSEIASNFLISFQDAILTLHRKFFLQIRCTDDFAR